ncbi:MAG TPA: hypothetical protein VLI93_12390 [Acetobacteraceae bacterium]|nr:hypothetical protein [Acetobacteraceae bacterium]
MASCWVASHVVIWESCVAGIGSSVEMEYGCRPETRGQETLMDQKHREPSAPAPRPHAQNRQPTGQQARQAREAEALRANLKRRKDQARARESRDQTKR